MSFRLQLPQRGWVTPQPIPREYEWRLVVRIGQGLFQEQLGSFAIPRLRQVEVHGLALAIDGTKQVLPLPGDPNEGFIHVPSGRFAFHFSLRSTVDFWTVGLSPPPMVV